MCFNPREGKYTIQTVFHDVQFSKSSHGTYKKILTEIYRKSTIDEFLPEFVKCLKVCILHEEKSANVERTLDFSADFAVSFSSDLTEDETCPLLEGVFRFIFDNHDCLAQLVRLRICQLMNRLLDNMGHDASVVEETYNKIAECMLVRLQDSMSSVRTQAVYALYRLQSPSDANCEIIHAFVYHMTHDPCHEVRRAVVQKIAVNKLTLASVLTRMNDIKDTVRKEAYTVISRFVIRQFTIKQRQLILENGLGDRSEVIRDYVIGNLVPNWLKYFNHNFHEFMECIHVEKIVDTAIKLLKAIFAKQHDVILEAKVREMHIVNQRVCYQKLNMVTVIFWRALVEYCKPTDDNDKFEHMFQQVLPDLTPFCQYIKDYYIPQTPNEVSSVRSSLGSTHGVNSGSPDESNGQRDSSSGNMNENSLSDEVNKEDGERNASADKKKPNKTPHIPDENVLVHLLEMCRVFDLSDEMGRNSLKQLCIDLLESPSVTLVSVPTLARLLDYIVPSPPAKLSVMAEVITELREPLQNNEASVYVPDLLLIEAEEKKTELGEKINELKSEMEIAEEIGDGVRIEEIKSSMASLKEELKILNTVTPHEPGRNINNDPDTLKKCLTIIVEIMKQGKIRKMYPTLLSLMQNFIIPTLNLRIEGDGSVIIKNLAMQALAAFCILDAELAKEHFFMFCFNIATETLSVTALKSVFDLLHVYGLNVFNIQDPDEANVKENSEEEGPKKPNLINLLTSLLISESPEMRRTAVVGLCKLLFAGRIKSADLVSKLILLWYNPEVESDPYIRQPLGVFFRMFAAGCPHAPELLLRAFLPTIRELFHLEVTNPMAEVEVDSVANLMVDLTRPHTNKFEKKDFSVHNQLAISICEEVLSQELEAIYSIVLVKLLSHLDLNFEIKTDMSILSALASRLVKTIPKEEKNLLRLAVKFEMMLHVRQEANKTASTINNTLPAEISTATGVTSRTSISLLPERNSDSDVEEEEEEDEEDTTNLSQDLTLSRTIMESEDVVVPASDESSDSDSEEPKSPRSPRNKMARVSNDSVFKYPLAPAPRTPAKTPFKVPAKSPRRASKTPAKTPSKSTAKTPGKTVANTTSKSSSKPTIKTPAKTTSNNSKTPSKLATKTPTKTVNTNSKTPVKRNPSRSPSKENTLPGKTPLKAASEDVATSERVTRSSKKRKS